MKCLTVITPVLPLLLLFIHLSVILVEAALVLINEKLLLYLLFSTPDFFGNGGGGVILLLVSHFELAFSSTKPAQFGVFFGGLSTEHLRSAQAINFFILYFYFALGCGDVELSESKKLFVGLQ